MESVIKYNQGDTKWDIRHKVWNYMEAKNLASFPRPVHNRIPNFKGAMEACCKFSLLEVFNKTSVVKVAPDKPLEGLRFAALQARKTLLVPTPRLRTGLFNRIIPPKDATKQELHVCSTSQGIREFSVPVGLDDKVKVDLVVVGSVAISEKGYRIGKGEGFVDMEYAMMTCLGAICESTVVVTIVHDCQVMDIPEELIESHDLMVDFIITPTRVIKTDCKRPEPQGIIWSKHQTAFCLSQLLAENVNAVAKEISFKQGLILFRGSCLLNLSFEVKQKEVTHLLRWIIVHVRDADKLVWLFRGMKLKLESLRDGRDCLQGNCGFCPATT